MTDEQHDEALPDGVLEKLRQFSDAMVKIARTASARSEVNTPTDRP